MHALLLEQVATRSEAVRMAIAEDRWPGRELHALLGYLRAEVLRQAADEERLLFPGRGASPDLTRLARDHARLRAETEVLVHAASGERAMPPDQLAAATRDFFCQLGRHLGAEEALLAASGMPGSVPATLTLGGHPHEWYPLTEGPVIDLDALPAGQAVDAAVDRLLRLSQWEHVELHASSDPYPVWRQVAEFTSDGYSFVYQQEGAGPLGSPGHPARGGLRPEPT
ncbi:MAG TPA: hemerythrin domain-containing protein [Streptosporangiaceae bacterium]|nr:hemerythrin domain-containing protein [Streptosporangiaceae bacterium]